MQIIIKVRSKVTSSSLELDVSSENYTHDVGNQKYGKRDGMWLQEG